MSDVKWQEQALENEQKTEIELEPQNCRNYFCYCRVEFAVKNIET